MKKIASRLACCSLALGLAWAAGPARAEYPEKPVRLVVPYTPAGGTDVLARLLAERLTQDLGQTFVVENRAGADGMIGTGFVAQSPADGYTLALVSSSHAVNPTLNKNISFDTMKDLRCITQTAVQQIILVSHPDLPVRSVAELIDYGKKHPEALYFASSSKASQLPMELFAAMAGMKMTNVPYKGSGPALTDMIAGRVQTGFIAAASAMPFIESAKLRALAIGDDSRSSLMPDLPTVAEAGVPGFQANLWSGIFAPAATPKPVIERLNQALVRIMQDPAFRKTMQQHGFEPKGSAPAQCDAFVAGEIRKWADVAAAAGIQAE